MFCLKAYSTTSKDKIKKIQATAWFCPDIPVGYGPMQYFGLPGLIIELHFSKMTFIVEKINLKNKYYEKIINFYIST